MAVDTNFLPKTNGLVFSDRLTARANKGRVFLYTVAGDEIVEPPPSMEPITTTINGELYDFVMDDPVQVTAGGTATVVVQSLGPASPTFAWQSRHGSDVVFTPDNAGTTTITFNSTGFFSCYCVLTDNESLEDSILVSMSFIAT